jgi:hypothetical protein
MANAKRNTVPAFAGTDVVEHFSGFRRCAVAMATGRLAESSLRVRLYEDLLQAFELGLTWQQVKSATKAVAMEYAKIAGAKATKKPAQLADAAAVVFKAAGTRKGVQVSVGSKTENGSRRCTAVVYKRGAEVFQQATAKGDVVPRKTLQARVKHPLKVGDAMLSNGSKSGKSAKPTIAPTDEIVSVVSVIGVSKTLAFIKAKYPEAFRKEAEALLL